ncbi:MAG: M13 family metallopeptidase [bacterium]
MSKTLNRVLLLILALVLFTVGCSQKEQPAISLSNLDQSVEPGEDFFRYANGGWLDKINIPEDKSSYSSFNVLREQRDEDIHELLEEVSKNKDAEEGSITQKISDFYATGMDVKKIEEEGLKPLQSEFDRIKNISSMQDFQNLVARFHTFGLDPLFGGNVMQDFMQSDLYKFYFMQAGVGLPDVEYYTKEDNRSKEIREEYVNHMTKMFELMGDESETARENAETVMEIETRLANNSRTRVQMRNIPALYNKMSLDKLSDICPNFNWDTYMANLSDTDFGEVIVGMPEFFQEVNRVLADVPLNDWKIYLRWNLVNRSAEYLSEDFVNQDFEFYSKFLSGNEKIQKRWKRVTQTINGRVGEPLGKLYTERHFPSESKERMMELIDNLKKAMAERLEDLEWMGKDTKKAALAKLEKMRFKIGYPDKWKDFSKLEIKRDSYVLNVRRANYFHFYRQLNKYGKPVDKEEWGMPPQTVNAGYNPMQNEMTFPAGILQPPFFNPDADDAVNYGAIGAVIGHEMTHGFDDQGRRFDAEGNMRDWWTPKDNQQFTERTKILIDQYNDYVAVDDVHINGELTLGENIADFGGLSISLHAYKMSLKDKPEPLIIDGFNHMQRFFLGWSQVWRGKIRDKALKRKCQEDVHPWGKFRVNGALANVPEFYQAFDIDKDDPLYRAPDQRPVIW